MTELEFRAETTQCVGEMALALSSRNGFQPNAGRSPVTNLRADCERILAASPEKRACLRAVFKLHGRVGPQFFGPGELELAQSTIPKALTQGSGLGATLVSEEISGDIYSLMLKYGAWRQLGVIPIAATTFKVLTVSGKADASWISTTNQGAAIAADASVTGTRIGDKVVTLATLVEVSNEALEDGQTTFEGGILEAIVEGLNFRLDWTCFRADGTDDTTDGAQTGVFADANVSIFTPVAGKTTLAALDNADFAAVIAKVAVSALQQPCRWWISPAFLPALLPLQDGPEYLLTRPARPGDDWMLLGFPVTWTAAAPAVNAAGQLVAAFGRGDAYTVALRQEFEITRGGVKGFSQNLSLIRAIARARCQMRDATSFALLKTAAA